MAKKRNKRRKRPPAETIPEAPAAKKRRKKKRRPESEPEPQSEPSTELEADDEAASLPPTKKSTLPPELAHDDREIDARSIARFSGIVILVTLATMVLVWFVDEELAQDERAGHAPPRPMASSLPDGPPEPRLQRVPKDGLAALRAQEAEHLETYGWVDEPRGVVRIPIDRAIDVLAERGLPTRAQESQRKPEKHPTDSSLEPRGGLR